MKWLFSIVYRSLVYLLHEVILISSSKVNWHQSYLNPRVEIASLELQPCLGKSATHLPLPLGLALKSCFSFCNYLDYKTLGHSILVYANFSIRLLFPQGKILPLSFDYEWLNYFEHFALLNDMSVPHWLKSSWGKNGIKQSPTPTP